MSDEAARPSSDGPAPLTPTGKFLTAQFYAWERRGRGWQAWPHPVELEPPFRPFSHATGPARAVVDDARRPTFLSALVETIRQGASPPVPDIEDLAWTEAEGEPEEPEPEAFVGDAQVIEIQTATPPELTVTLEAAERFLLGLAYLTRPVSFELIGRADAITVQLACAAADLSQLRTQLHAHFPEVVLTEASTYLQRHWEGSASGETLVVDYGLSNEFMLPLMTVRNFDVDPLIGLTGALAELREGELAVLQVLFQPARHPWADQVLRAVTSNKGDSFFADAPEMVTMAKDKVAFPLFAVRLRTAVRSPDAERTWKIARSLGAALKPLARIGSNELIPLSGADYDEALHSEDFLHRRTRRSGMLLNSQELVSLVHLPSASVRSKKLRRLTKKTRAAPTTTLGQQFVLGENTHAGKTAIVTLSAEERTRHMYVIGASGMGKSHLLVNLMIQDMQQGQGIGVLDPHGDLIDKVLGYVPEERIDDIVLFDPSDAEYPVGFNILSAHSDAEKNQLASDMVAGFQRLATSWGDQMTTVLSNAVLAFLESSEGGTLVDLKRFLVEKDFRDRFLKTVQDEEIVYYWEEEFPLLRGNPQASLLTRLNTFLRQRLIRNLVGQPENRLDIGQIMNTGKIFLARLPEGLIGKENTYLLGTLLISKFQQIAMSRQEMKAEDRRPFYLYVDEFHNFMTPSMEQILSGARKYGLGLTLAHQDMEQLSGRGAGVASSVLTNPYTRICFRVGDRDAKKLQDGFASFTAKDLQQLSRGDALCRVERADHDFNLRALPHPALDDEVAKARTEAAIEHSRATYATPRAEVEAALRQAAGRPPKPEADEPAQEAPESAPAAEAPPESQASPESAPVPTTAQKKEEAAEPGAAPVAPATARPSQPAPLGRGGPKHRSLQEDVKRWAGSRGWTVTIEKPVLDGTGSVDVALERGECSVACEISVASTPAQELGNVQKCLSAGFQYVVVVSTDRASLTKASGVITPELDEEASTRVHFLTPEELFVFLEEREAESAGTQDTVRGYKVTTQYRSVDAEERKERMRSISQVILDTAKQIKDKE